jgi:hypothetical protein
VLQTRKSKVASMFISESLRTAPGSRMETGTSANNTLAKCALVILYEGGRGCGLFAERKREWCLPCWCFRERCCPPPPIRGGGRQDMASVVALLLGSAVMGVW